MKARCNCIRLALVGVVVILGAAGCSDSQNAGQAVGPITIGASVSLSGKYASSGQSLANGYQMAVDTVNAAGGVEGRKLDLQVNDDKSDAATVTRLYTDMLADHKVAAVLSPYGSTLAGAAMQLSERYQIPMVHSITSYGPAYDAAQYSVMAGVGTSSRIFADLPSVAKTAGYTTIAFAANDLDSYAGTCSGASAAAREQGLKIVAEESYAATTSDFSSLALKVKNAQPEVVVVCSAISDSISMTRALDQQGFRPKLLAVEAAEDASFADSVGSLADRVIGFSTWVPGLKRAGSQEFAEKYEEKFGKAPNYQSASGYAAVQVLTAAMKAAGGSSAGPINEKLHSQHVETILGRYQVDEHGVQTGYSPVLIQYQGEKLHIIYPKSDATAELEPSY